MKKYCVSELFLIQFLHTKIDTNYGIKQQKTGTEKPQKSASFQFWTESFRPDQKIQTVAFAAVLIFCLERTDSNGKILLSGSNVSLGLVRNTPNLRGIHDDFAVHCLRNLLIVAKYRDWNMGGGCCR